MVAYTYYGVTPQGKEKKGTLEADNQQMAQAALEKKGIFIITISEANFMDKDMAMLLKKKAKPRDYSIFCRQFVSMLRAGVTIVDALEMLGDSTQQKRLAQGIRQTAIAMRKGEGFAEAMSKNEIFPDTMVQMVGAGEDSGNIEESFERLANQYEKDAKLDAMMKKASIYPIIVGVVSLLVLVFMLVKVIPGYSEMFAQLGEELPFITRAVVSASDFLIANWYFILVILAVLIVAVRYYSSTTKGRYVFGKLAIRIPVLGKLNICTSCSKFARTASTLLAAGMPMIQALEMVERVLKNQLYKDVVQQAREDVARGLPISGTVTQSGLFPPMVCHMLRIGEETGDLDGMMGRLADYCDEEVEMSTQSVMAALEPCIILLLAVLVVILIGAIMSPMMALYGSLESL